MVDAIASSTTNRKERSATKADGIRTAATTGSAVLDGTAYAAFASGKTHAPAQSPLWVNAWINQGRTDAFVVLVRNGDGAEIALPLEVTQLGPLRIAGFMSGSHANGNMPVARGAAGSLSAATIAAAVRALRPDIDLIILERLVYSLGGTTNPLAHLASQQSPNISLAVELDGGFEAVLGRTSGKRKRKKHRSQTRKFEAVGPIRIVEAGSEVEVDRILAEFFELKAQRFRELGLKDVFAEPQTQSFFRELFVSALNMNPRPFELHGLEVAGKLRAITGSSRSADRIICEFGAIAADDLGHASPGEFLFYEQIQDACTEGRAVYDFSVGDEYYKRLWCNLEEHHFDVRIPISIAGRALGTAMGVASGAKRAIKSNKVIWSAIKRLRRSKAAVAQNDQDDS